MLKELLLRRFSLFSGLLALASILVLSYFYYRLHTNSPFVYEQIIANISEYRVLDSRIYIFGRINFDAAKDNLEIQQSLVSSTKELFYDLSNQKIKVPNADALYEIEKSIASRMRWLATCSRGDSCNIDEWNNARARAWESCETLLASFYNLLWEQEEAWSKNLRIFYLLSVILLLSTLFFAAKRK
ncbi:MAG: hypothetical protein FWC26_02285 [Fibromonadales bacterium]|nr:hypothetical protein [Fibromonadales bacterium]